MDVSPTDVAARTKRTTLAWKLDGPLFSSLEELHEKLAELLGKGEMRFFFFNGGNTFIWLGFTSTI